MGFGNTIGFNYVNNMYSQPMMNGWNTTFDWNTPNWGISDWSSSSGTSSSSKSSSKKESAAEYEARIKKEIAEKNEKNKTLYAQKQECQKGLDLIKQQEDMLASGTKKQDGSVEIKGVRQADGTIKEEKLNEMSTGAKIFRGGINLLSGIGNVCKSLAGFDSETGKWDPVKCVRNVAIAAGVGALCAFAAPLGAAAAAALGGGAVATGVGTCISAIPAALATVGLGTGVYMAGKGIKETSDAIKNNDLDAFDHGTQDLGAGLFIGISSAMGLKSISRSLGADAAAATASSTSRALPSATESSFLSRVGASVPNGLKNIFINPWKASAANFRNASSVMTEAGGGLTGFKTACKNTWTKPTEAADSNMQRSGENLLANMREQAQKLQTQLDQAQTPKEELLIRMQMENLAKTGQKLTGANNKTGWKNLTEAYSESQKTIKDAIKVLKTQGNVEIKGETFTIEDLSALQSQLKILSAQQKALKSQINSFKATTFDTMRTYAMHGSADKAGVAEQFGFSTKWYAQPWNWLQSKYYGFVKPTSTLGWIGKGLNVSFLAVEPYWAAQGVIQNPATTASNVMFAYNPVRTKSEGSSTTITAEEIAQTKAQLEPQKEQLKNAMSQINSELGIA